MEKCYITRLKLKCILPENDTNFTQKAAAAAIIFIVNVNAIIFAHHMHMEWSHRCYELLYTDTGNSSNHTRNRA